MFKVKKFSKLLDLSIFTNDKNSIWDDWSSKVREKIDSNVNYYLIEKLRIIYILTRLRDNVVIYIYYRREKNTTNLYLIYKNILLKLAKMYKDSD